MPKTVGELVMIRVSVPAQELEDVLDMLAGLQFPVNPELFSCGGETRIEFPAYGHQLEEVYSVLPEQARVETVGMFAELGI